MTREELIRQGWIPVPGHPTAFYIKADDAYKNLANQKHRDAIVHAQDDEFEKFLQNPKGDL